MTKQKRTSRRFALKSAAMVAVMTFILAACGLKGSLSLQNGAEGGQGAVTGGGGAQGAGGLAGTNDHIAVGGNGLGAGQTGGGSTGGTTGQNTTTAGKQQTQAGSALFPNETEGITKDEIRICSHVPITGAAPVPHDPDRFGQFYFDYVNKELGGVYGRKVKFIVYDDGYYPAGARQAMEKCARIGSFIYGGAAGTDQIVSISKWAELRKVPYVHGPTAIKDLRGLKYNVTTGPPYEYQSKLLADYSVKRFGKDVPYAMIRINSPYFDAAHDAYVAELAKYGIKLAVDAQVQKDESQFTNIFHDLTDKNVKVINNFTTPNIWIKMLKQRPPSYQPAW